MHQLERATKSMKRLMKLSLLLLIAVLLSTKVHVHVSISISTIELLKAKHDRIKVWNYLFDK